MGLFDFWYNRNKTKLILKGESFTLDGDNYLLTEKDYRKISLRSIAVLTIFSHTCDIFSQARFTVQDKDGNPLDNDPLIERLKNPNYTQTQSDFLYQHLWYKMLGANYIYNASNALTPNPKRTNSLFNLYFQDMNFERVRNWRKFVFTPEEQNEYSNLKVGYLLNGVNIDVAIKDIIPYYDVSNLMDINEWIESPSKMKAAIPVIESIDVNLKAKKKATSFSDKYIVTNKDAYQGVSKPLRPEDKNDIENKMRFKDIMATSANVEVNNLAPDFRKLMLDDAFSHDVLKLAMLWGMNKDVLNYFTEGTTYENQEKAFINWLQGKIMSEIENFAEGLTSYFGYEKQGKKLVGSIDHLPAIQRYKESQGTAYKTLNEALTIGVQNGLIEVSDAEIVSQRYLKML